MSQLTVAVIGASSDRAKFGNKSVRAHLAQGYDVYPVNPKGGEIEGLRVYASVGDIPVDSLDRVSVYLPPPVLLEVLDSIAAKGCRELFLNPGSESDEVLAKAEALGLNAIVACSIVDVGHSPSDFSEV
jgi:predicted CoA-binding protein